MVWLQGVEVANENEDNAGDERTQRVAPYSPIVPGVRHAYNLLPPPVSARNVPKRNQ